MNQYAHLYTEAGREVADKMDAIPNPVASGFDFQGTRRKAN